MSEPIRLVALGVSHQATPLQMRERLAVPADRLPELYRMMREQAAVREAMVLNTCNRVEVYAVIEGPEAEQGIENAFCAFQRIERADLLRHRFFLHDREAVGHLLGVASGVESQIVGETEIFGQVKAAYSGAVGHGTAGPILHRVVQKSFQAAKFIRNNTAIGSGQISVATVAVDLTEKIFGPLRQSRVLVLGTGDVGEKTVKAMASRGATSITVLSRSLDRARHLAATVGARADVLDRLPHLLPEYDIVIGSTQATEPIVSAAMARGAMRQRKVRPLFFIDLGIPRNFDAALGGLHSVFLYDLDDLARIADENLAARRAAIERCRHIIEEKAQRIWDGAATRLGTAPPAVAKDALQTEARGQPV